MNRKEELRSCVGCGGRWAEKWTPEGGGPFCDECWEAMKEGDEEYLEGYLERKWRRKREGIIIDGLLVLVVMALGIMLVKCAGGL